jgi:uncharacterized protein YjiS (DUF1127 family)
VDVANCGAHRTVATAHRAEGYRALTAFRRIIAAIRLWRDRARSPQQLRELSDYMVDDIGLRREELGYEPAKPFD